MELGEAQDETQLEAALKKVAINECCTLVFTVSTYDMILNQVQGLTRYTFTATKKWAIQAVFSKISIVWIHQSLVTALRTANSTVLPLALHPLPGALYTYGCVHSALM